MEILKFHTIKHSFGDKKLYYDVAGAINRQDKIGLIGQNGCGKTTLVKIFLGDIKPDQGEVVLASKNIGYVPQDFEIDKSSPFQTVEAFAMSQHSRIANKYVELKKAEKGLPDGLNWYTKALGDFQEVGGYEALNDVHILLKKSGFSEADYERKVTDLSEGQKRLVYLIGILGGNPDFLILDEPTNHVDYELKDRYINLTAEVKVPVLVISHDREVLSRACNHIWELEEGVLQKYRGNWDVYAEEHGKRLINAVRSYEKQTDDLEREQARLKLYQQRARLTDSKIWATRISQTKRRIERIEKAMPEIAPKLEKDNLDATLKYEGKSSQFMLRVEDLNIWNNENFIVTDLDFVLKKGERMALTGGNGSGKSTVVKVILGECDYAEHSGEIRMSPSAQIGYFNQKLTFPDDSVTLYRHIEKTLHISRSSVYGIIEKYLFDKSQENTPLYKLSGGERNRLHLMKLIEGNYNLLILDEPTNHLDLYQIETLEQLVQEYNGTVLLISHDQYFRESVTDFEVSVR